MIHPLLHLVATKPYLIAEHVGAYAELVGAEVEKSSKQMMSRLLYGAVALFLLSSFIIFTGVAIMLWALVPLDNMNAPWLLLVVPVVPLVAGVVCAMKAANKPEQGAFATVKEQIDADLAMLRQVGATS
jgi:uncharacterized membrane protein YqjE